eukprot:jgi/Tetstr1/462031/TSEL_007102.t1
MARAVLAERHRRRGARRAGGAGDGVGWGAVDHLSDVDMVHMPAEMSMETAVPIDFQEAWAEAQRCVNERVVAAVEAGDPVVLDRALKWKYMLPQLLLRAPSRGGRRRLQALAWRFRAFAERRMTELVRSWDDARTEAFYAGHARQRRTDANLFAALLLRDKHPSRSHPIPDAAYDIPVDEAALTVDLRVPYQQLKQHVAAGPSGMRNEYLRCLVGEYAPASGPAAVRAMSEVASMYLQGRLPGWFNRHFASARLVAPVKKLGEGRAPDVRPVAVGEAERRAAKRAVVDNMKEAYVSVLAPSQLGVGIPAGDSMLIHGVRLIAEKLGPRAVIVHTDLRNAYNEAWRRTIIQRHIDCSPLHPVIPALLASLSTDSYLVVDDRSAPLRSEDGVQQGAPLATTSFCVAIHPEVQKCDTTLEVNDGTARFNADDGFLVGLPEHVWPALHAFRTSIKASVGFEVRFDKMQAYSADMDAARREAPADIEWPELDGHHGIAVLNVPLGSPEYVHAYMRGKAEELREEKDASLSKLLSAKPSRRRGIGSVINCLPSEVEAFAEAVDATILAAVEPVLGVSFDPSTYGTDTNPVVTDFLAELLHDPDLMAAEVATLSEDAVARARSRLHLPTRLRGGAGIRRMATVRDAAFIGCMNAVLPRFLTRNSGTNTPTPGFFDPQLGSVLGRGSFNAPSSARQYDHFLNDAHGSDSYAAEMREAWGRLQAATAGHLGDAYARQMEREVEAASGSQKELTAFLDQANNSRLRNEVCALPATCRERILFNQLDAASGMWTVAIPTARTAMTPHELREVVAGYFLLPSPCLAPVVGSQIILPSTEHNPVNVDLYGDALMNLPAPGDAHWRVHHDAIADAFRDHCVHDLGIAVRREVDDLFQQAVPLGNTVPRDELKDLVPDADLSLPAFNVVTGSYDPRSLKSTLLEFKTMRYGVKYTAVPRATAVDRFERSLLGDIQRGLAARDAAWHNTEPGQKGPLRDILDMLEYTGMVFGTVETSIKASVGFEVRFDKMQAYSADMDAARREAPADIEWPELDGHHGIAVLNVPLGSPEYVHAYMRGKAEELREEKDASLSKLLSAKPSRRRGIGSAINCLPSEVEAFAEAVDATILAAVEPVLGVSFDPSTYGTDTNPVVTDFLAELLHDPDLMAAEVATLSEDAVARARSRLHLPTRLRGGAGIRRMATVRDAAFIGCMNAVLPRFLTRNSGTNTPTPGFFDPQLGSVLGRGSFNAPSSARQYDHFLNDAHGSDSYAAEMREVWGRLQAATAGHLGDAYARQMEREVEAASGSQKELTAFLDQANNSRLRNEVCALPATCRERILFNQLDAASGMWTVAIPTARTAMTPHELREVVAGYFLLPSPCLAPVVGSQIILPSTEHNPVNVDLYGDALMNLPAPGDAHWRVHHDAIADAFRDHCVHDLGIAVRREVDDLFQQAVPLGNTVPRDELKDLVPDADLSLPAFNVVTGSYDPRSLKSTLLEFKTMRYGVKYTAVPRATAVDRFERSLLGDIQRGLAARDAAWHNTEPGQKGPLRDILDMLEYTGMVFGTVETSIKASVGFEVRFDKMQAYSADMDAARREAPADIEWPELDGHHGIAVLNVPLGSPEYVHAYMRGKAEELREEKDASLSKLLSAKPSRRRGIGSAINCLPSEVEAFAEAVDATILAAVEPVLGVSFDPSTYGTDTNPVVTDFLAELLHDPDLMAAEVATLSEDAVARARSRLHLPTRLRGGAGIRRMATVRDAAFIGCMNAVLPRFLTRNSGTNTPTPGFFDPQLGSVLGRGSFNAPSSARQYDHFLNDAHGSDSYAAEMREVWGRLQAATAGHLGDAYARQMEREMEAASGSQKELTAFLDQANNSRLRNEVCALPATCRERILFNQLDAASGMWTVAIPTARTAMTPHELREVVAGYFLLPSPCLAPVVGSQIILPSTEHNPVNVDLYGDALMNLPAPGDAHWRVHHDAIADAFRDHCVHDLGIAVRREVDDLFQQAVPLGNTVPRDELKDLVPDADLSLPAFNVVTGSYDPRSLKSTLLEFKTMRYGVKYTAVPRATAVDRFERSLLGDIQRGLAARDAAWHNTEPGQKGPLRDILDMLEYTGMVFGTV